MAVENVIYKIQTEGAEQFKRDLEGAAKAQVELTKSVENSTKATQEYNQALNARKNQLSTLDKESEAYRELEAEIKAAEVAIGSLNKSGDTMRKQFVETKKQIEGVAFSLQELEKAGLRNTETYRNLTTKLKELEKQGGELKDGIGDLNTKLKNLGSDTKGIDAVIGGLQGIVATTEIAMGAQALFGANSKDLEETLIKLNGVMAVANGIQQVQNLLQKESALAIGVTSLAQSAYTAVVEASTIALGAFRAATMALGLGAVIALVYGLYEAWKSLADAEKEAADAAQLNKDRRELTNKELENELATLKLRNEFEVKNGKDRIQAQKELTAALYALWQNRFQTQSELNQRIAQLEQEGEQKNAAEIVKLKKEAAANQINVANAYYEYLNSKKLEDVKNEKKASDEKIKIKKAEKSELELIANDLLNQNEQSRKAEEGEKKRIEQDEKDRQLTLKTDLVLVNQKANEQILASDKKKVDIQKDLDDELTRKKLENQKILVEATRFLSEVTSAAFDLQIQNIQNESQVQLDELNTRREAELSNDDLTAREKEAITQKYLAQERAIKLRAWKAEQQAKEAQAVMNGALAITNIFANGLPVAWPFLLGSVLASTAAQVAIIRNQKAPKFAEGGAVADRGLIIGKPHEAGGKLIEVEGNEFVFKKEAVKHYGVSMLNQMNDLKLAKPNDAKGLVIEPINYDKLGNILSEKLKQNPLLRVSIDKRGVNTSIGGKQVMNNYIDF